MYYNSYVCVTTRESWGSICKALFWDSQNTGRVGQWQTGITDKAESSPKASVGRRSANNIQQGQGKER